MHRLGKNKTIHLESALIVSTLLLATCLLLAIAPQSAESQNQTQPISSREAFLRAQRAARSQQQASSTSRPPAPTITSTNKPPQTIQSSTKPQPSSTPQPPPPSAPQSLPAKLVNTSGNQQQTSHSSNRTTRTADIFQNGDGFNIFVTNTCERELMHVNIKTSRPFYGVIHTQNQRQKPGCIVEGNGGTEYNLDINHVLNSQDPNYCGVIKARKESPEDKDLLSVVLAVRVHRNIELSDDKFFLLNCTYRCRRPDCSMPSPSARLTNGRLTAPSESENEVGERESATPATTDQADGQQGNRTKNENDNDEKDECTIWKFPWLITLLWCMGILLLFMIISHCIMCSSLVCRCVKTEVEETEPSIYEGATDDEDSLYNRKNHPMRIDYDNRDIYKTSNNYEPYCLEDTQAKTRHANKKSKQLRSSR